MQAAVKEMRDKLYNKRRTSPLTNPCRQKARRGARGGNRGQQPVDHQSCLMSIMAEQRPPLRHHPP